jgi:hypothetical protein
MFYVDSHPEAALRILYHPIACIGAEGDGDDDVDEEGD